jgi:hypothetical protein
LINLKLYCTLEEKLAFLRNRGFTVELREVQMMGTYYHNQSDFYQKEVYVVLDREGKPYLKPGGYSFQKEDWLDAAFTSQVSDRLKDMILA